MCLRNSPVKMCGSSAITSSTPELIVDWPDVDFGHAWKLVLAFRIGASFKSLLGAWIAATAYARATDGIVFDEADAKLNPPDDALKLIRNLERDLPRFEQQMKELQDGRAQR